MTYQDEAYNEPLTAFLKVSHSTYTLPLICSNSVNLNQPQERQIETCNHCEPISRPGAQVKETQVI